MIGITFILWKIKIQRQKLLKEMPVKWIRITFMFVIKRIIHVELDMAAATAVAGAICNRNTACRKFFYCPGKRSAAVEWWLVSPFIKKKLYSSVMNILRTYANKITMRIWWRCCCVCVEWQNGDKRLLILRAQRHKHYFSCSRHRFVRYVDKMLPRTFAIFIPSACVLLRNDGN